MAREHGLSDDEFNRILEILGREPNFVELGIFSVMWSEHCSYKSSIKMLKTFPREGSRLLVEAGEENAKVSIHVYNLESRKIYIHTFLNN